MSMNSAHKKSRTPGWMRVVFAGLLCADTAGAMATPFLVEYDLANNVNSSGSISGDPLVPRAYPSTSSNPTFSASAGVLSLSTSESTPTFFDGTTRIAGLRPQLVGLGDPARSLFEAEMVASKNPFMEVEFRNIGEVFSMQALGPSNKFVFFNNASDIGFGSFSSANNYVPFNNEAWNTLRIQTFAGLSTSLILNGLTIGTQTVSSPLFASADSGSLTLEVRSSSQTIAGVELRNFRFGNEPTDVPEPSALALLALGMLALVALRRRAFYQGPQPL